MVERLSAEERNRLVFEVAAATDLNRFLKTDLVKREPVMRFEVDFEISCISVMFDKSITDLDNFLSADGVKLVSNMPRAASPSNKSGRCFGQICVVAIYICESLFQLSYLPFFLFNTSL
jgi:hypothetical protein